MAKELELKYGCNPTLLPCCHELWCRLQMLLRSGIAVAMV